MFARCTSMVDGAPSSMGAFSSACLRLRMALRKFAKWLPPSARRPRLLLLPQIRPVARTVEHQVAFRPVESVADGVRIALLAQPGLVVCDPVTHFKYQELLFTA